MALPNFPNAPDIFEPLDAESAAIFFAAFDPAADAFCAAFWARFWAFSIARAAFSLESDCASAYLFA